MLHIGMKRSKNWAEELSAKLLNAKTTRQGNSLQLKLPKI